ncbi:hypothetical protein PROVRETT_06396 [Providencia rettgeri DSM 1131]|nr:hypothetical protein PROVRETT_06396 [Providencia rettgeri DSM 1131]
MRYDLLIFWYEQLLNNNCFLLRNNLIGNKTKIDGKLIFNQFCIFIIKF